MDMDPFEFLDVTLEEAKETEERLLVGGRYDRDKRICACGHPMNSHTTYAGAVFCKPSKMECPCKKTRAVLIAGDARKFLRKTVGPGSEHALVRGVLASVEAGKTVEWTIEMKCDKCGVEGKVTPVPVNQHGIPMYEATGHDALLCNGCREA